MTIDACPLCGSSAYPGTYCDEGLRELDELIWALTILHGTWRDAWAPKGFVPPFKLAIGPLRAAVGIVEPEKTTEEQLALLDAMPPAPWLRGAP